MVVVNLYSFEKTAGQSTASLSKNSSKNIDIGGPSMIRSAAKNSTTSLS